MILFRAIYYFFVASVYFAAFLLSQVLFLQNWFDLLIFIVLITYCHFFYLFGRARLRFREIELELEQDDNIEGLDESDRAVYIEIQQQFIKLAASSDIYQTQDTRQAIKSLFKANPIAYKRYLENHEDMDEYLKI